MAHKHNRRRSRRQRSQDNTTPGVASGPHSLDHFIVSQPVITSATSSPDLSHPVISQMSSLPVPAAARSTRPRSEIPAMLWQNRFTAWQERERVRKERAAKFEAQQIQLFGGEPGDDVELCFRMLEYFGGLDYIS